MDMSLIKETAPYLERQVRFQEAAATGDLPTLLRADYKDILLSSYQRVEKPELALCYNAESDKQSETYRGLKPLPDGANIVPEGGEYPRLMVDEKSTVTVYNNKRGHIIEVTEEMIMFSKLAEIKRLGVFAAESLARQVPQTIVAAIETTTNTTASASASMALTRANLETVIAAYKVQTDTASDGTTIKLGLVPDTLLVPPALEYDARRILQSTSIPGSANNDINVLRGALDLMVSPWLTSTSLWYVLKKAWVNGLLIQWIIGPNPELSQQLQSSDNPPESAFNRDSLAYKARLSFGVGVIDAKWCIRSTT